MIFGLLNRRTHAAPQPAASIHDAIVAAARAPALYRELGAPDALPARFELIVLHAALVLRRLRAADAGVASGLGQEIFDEMFRALDANLREIGIGDVTVPKRIKTMARSFYDGAAAYDAALDARDTAALSALLKRIVYAGAPIGARDPDRLAAYAMRCEASLSAQPVDDLIARGPAFASPGGAAS